AAASASGAVRTWAVTTGKLQHECTLPLGPAGREPAGRLAFSPDLRWLAAVEGKAVRLADVTAGKALPPPAVQPEAGQFQCVWSPDGKVLATPGGGRLLLGDGRTGRLLRRTEKTTGEVYWLAFAPDGKQVVTLSYERPTARPRLADWDVATGKRLSQVEVAV